jgi:hypothetical protein
MNTRMLGAASIATAAAADLVAAAHAPHRSRLHVSV